jgi:hypothetical protein
MANADMGTILWSRKLAMSNNPALADRAVANRS